MQLLESLTGSYYEQLLEYANQERLRFTAREELVTILEYFEVISNQ
jgi:hypothetical protein